MARNFMDAEYIKELLWENVDADDVKGWYENYECGGGEFERMADALCDVNPEEFIWQVADYISEELDEEGFIEVIKEENWDIPLGALQSFKYDAENNDIAFINCTIKWKEDNKEEDVVISFIPCEELEEDDSPYYYTDEDIFFYVEDAEDAERLFSEDNGEDFVIVAYESCE